VPALTSLYLKYTLLNGTAAFGSGGFSIAAQSLRKPEGFTLLEKFSFFRADILVALIVPLALLALPKFPRYRGRVIAVGAFSAGVTLALYAQLRAFREVGQFISFQMFLTGLRWGWREPWAYTSYLGNRRFFMLLALIVSITAALLWLSKRDEELARRRRIVLGWLAEGAALALLILLSVMLLPLRASQMLWTPYHRSVLLVAFQAYWGQGEVKTEEFVGLSTPELLSQYRELTHAPAPQTNPSYWGKAKGSNVIYFVLETIPARFLPLEETLDDLPNLRRLRDNSFVALHHNTTFPRTHEAVFSLLSSWYPSDVTRTFEEQHPDLAVPGIMRSLSSLGYHTAIYSPLRRWNSFDEEMFQTVGVEQQLYPPDALQKQKEGGLYAPLNKDLRADWQKKRTDRDIATLALMEEDIEHSLADGRNFGAVFLPQSTHFPYPDVPQGSYETDLPKRARALLAIEDAWLGELMQLLERHQQLQNTIIVVTGDHGVRNSEEDSSFEGGMIDEYSFHVPLLIYAPRALDRTVTIPYVTSHIDVAPTVLDLLGVEEGREFEQGTSIWNAEIAERKTFFLANPVFGADGFYSNGRYYMWNHMSDAVSTSRNPHFDVSDISPESSPIHDEVPRTVSLMAGLQQVVAAHFSGAKSMRNHIFTHAVADSEMRSAPQQINPLLCRSDRPRNKPL
jgi:phosphoglycerol transferase MdoB-like AlkP superfamily enzyme